MNANMPGHNHAGRGHLLGMFAAGAAILVVLLAAGRSLGEALPLAALLACPLMMIGMVFMMRHGDGHQHAADSYPREQDHASPVEPPGPATSVITEPPRTTPLP